jgi:hypothetical protein
VTPARYFPIESGRYEVKPGLFKFGTDFGNGDADRQVFQIDDQFPRYHAVKLAARQEQLSKYYQPHDYPGKRGSASRNSLPREATIRRAVLPRRRSGRKPR